MTYTTETINRIFSAYTAKHQDMLFRWNHYKGKMNFLNKLYNSDGSLKSNVPVNFLEYIVDSHAAGSTANPFNYVPLEENQDPTPFDNLKEIIDENNLETVDTEHYRTALAIGYSVEVLSVKKGKIHITNTDPMEWGFVYDENNNIQIAIHKKKISENTFWRNEFVNSEFMLYTIFDKEKIYEFRTTSSGVQIVGEYINFFGMVPVVIFYLNEEKEAFLTNNIIEQNNLYNRLINNRVDDIDYNVDSLLKITGYGGVDVSNTDDLAKLKAMKEAKIFVIPDAHSNIEFITKGNEGNKYNEASNQIRTDLFLQAKIPDRKDITGAVGSLSGIAIKHMYQPTIQQSEYYLKYFKKCLRERINIINRIWMIQGKPLLENFDISNHFYLPIDLESITNAVKNLEGIVSKTKQLEMIPGVDAQLELDRMETEKGNEVPSSTPVQESIIDKPLAEKEAIIENKISNYSDNLNTQYLEELKKRLDSEVLNSPEFRNLFE